MEDIPTRLPEKLKQIRERTRLTPQEFAPHVKAEDGKAIESYESGEGDLPVSVLSAYAKLQNVPVENLLDDDRDLLFGHLQEHERPQKAAPRRRDNWVNFFAIIGFITVVITNVWFWGWALVGFILWFITELWKTLFVS